MAFDKWARGRAGPGGRVRAPLFRLLAAAAVWLLAGAVWAPSIGAQSPAPDESYLTLHTANFRVSFPRGLEEVARRAAERAERVHAVLSETFLPPPAGPIDLLVTDQADISNGFAVVAPSNRIVIWIRPPTEGLALSHFDDWLELVVTHELVHIFHLDYAGPVGRIARRVFGRAPRRWPFFIGNTLPTLAIEGVAVHLESDLTDGGRLHGTFHEAQIRGHYAGRGAERVDQGLGGTPVWPGGDRPYVYGSVFFRSLAERYGEEAVNGFLKEWARQWVPYRLDAAARRAFGSSFQELWDEWLREMEGEVRGLEEELAGRAPLTRTESLTRGARIAFHPAPDPSGSGKVAFLRSDGRSDTRLVLLDEGEERSLSRWNGVAAPSWTPEGGLVAPQLEFADPYRMYRDLYRVAPDGRVTRLTRSLRVAFADVHPGDGRILAVLDGGGTNRLVLLSPEGRVTGTLREGEPGVLWSYPRWSPDGERIAVARWRAGAWNAVLLLDGEGRTLATLAEDRSLHTAPTWSPDGRFVLWSSDRSGVLNIYAREVAEAVAADGEGAEADPGGLLLPGELRQATHLLTAGHYPAVSPDGRWLYLSVLRGEGWELERIPFEPGAWMEPLSLDPRYGEGGHRMADGHEAQVEGRLEPYSAFPTLRPRYWLPVHVPPKRVAGVEVLPRAWGLETSASDLLGRHRYDLTLSAPPRSPGRHLEARVRYSWAGLGNPVLFFQGDQRWAQPFLVQARPEDGAPVDTLFHTERERSLGVGADLLHQRFRRAARLTLTGAFMSRERSLLEETGPDGDLRTSQQYRLIVPSGNLLEGRLTLGFGSARTFPFSVSTQEGVGASVTLRERRHLALADTLRGDPRADGSFRDVLGAVTAYKGVPGPGFAEHVLGIRLAAGASRGPGAGNNHFALGGGGGGGDGALGFTYDAARGAFPVRGFARGEARGRRAWGASAEWRFPLGILHRGFGAWPLHLDRVAGGVFMDVASAERAGSDGGSGWTLLSSAGGELGLTRSLLFERPTFVRAGFAVPLRGPPVEGGRSPSLYAGFGWGF